jgi:hypothetical protein
LFFLLLPSTLLMELYEDPEQSEVAFDPGLYQDGQRRHVGLEHHGCPVQCQGAGSCLVLWSKRSEKLLEAVLQHVDLGPC